jgi:hypothetical protein
MSTQTYELLALPPVLPSFVKAGLSATRRPKGAIKLPDRAAHVGGIRIDAAHLAAYNALCGFASATEVPLTYPQVLATPLYLHLMTQPGFPLPLMGLVHIRNHIEQSGPIDPAGEYEIALTLAGGRQTQQGYEIDLVTEFSPAGGEVVSRATMTVLYRGPKPPKLGPKPPPPVVDARLTQYFRFAAAADTGRRYAKLSQDYNPIHLYATTAKLFGFPRAIAHGMWSAARCLALLQPEMKSVPTQFAVQFKQPLLLPGRVALGYSRDKSAIDFSLFAAGGGKVHLSGTLR